MNELVLQVQGAVDLDERPYVAITLKRPPVFGSRTRPLGCTGDEPQFTALRQAVLDADAIRLAGRFLYDAVVRHPEVAERLAVALRTDRAERYPIFVEIATGAGVETLPWEAMCSPAGDFLGLDERFALGRIVERAALARPFWQFQAPLRIAAVLSCLNVPAASEWESLQSALMPARDGLLGGDLPVEMLVLVSEEALHDEIGAVPGVRVEMVPRRLDRLQRIVGDFQPHVLHLFCHGSAEGSPHLQLAVKSDWVTGTPDNSVLVEAREVRDFTARTDDRPWLVMLNCCESARSESTDLQSLALNLVYDGGVPAVVGMREPVSSTDASLFTGMFYDQLLPELSRRMDGSTPATDPVDWARLVARARTRLVRTHPGVPPSQVAASTKEWTLPVVYTLPEPFTVKVERPPLPPFGMAEPQAAPTDRAARLEIEALRGILPVLPANAPASLRTEIEQRLAALVDRLSSR